MRVEQFDRLRSQLEYCYSLPFYRERFGRSGLRPADIRVPGDLARLPPLSRRELTGAFVSDPPHGGFYSPAVVRINLSPSPEVGFLPVYSTRADLEQMSERLAAHLHRLGITGDDVVGNAFSYHLFIAGMVIQQACERLGAACIPLGPGNSEQHARIINRFGAAVLIANASFALKVAGAGARGVRLLMCGGEPFSSVRGAREAVLAAFGGDCIAIDSYGLAEAGIVAAERRSMDGMYVDEDQFYVELLDPETGAPVPDGERAEIVVTHLQRQGLPLLRFRTGDLTVAQRRPEGQDSVLVFPQGILGRVDNMVKVKGVKLYPGEITRVLASVPGLAGVRHQIRVARQGGADVITLCLQADPAAVDADVVRARFKQEMHIALNGLEYAVDPLAGGLVVDQR